MSGNEPDRQGSNHRPGDIVTALDFEKSTDEHTFTPLSGAASRDHLNLRPGG